jgi:LL-diaminopimelate aminotransferase
MATINSNYDKLSAGYLFPEIAKRTKAFSAANSGVQIYRLGIGNTTEPLPRSVITGLKLGVDKLADVKTYSGYGDEQGDERLRERIANVHYCRAGVKIDPSEIFVSDGAKCDAANIQQIFGIENIIAVQDPAYPVYVDTNVASGRTGVFDRFQGKYSGIKYMLCNEQNGFFPEDEDLLKPDREFGEGADLIYLCSPNNPTGCVATKAQLKKFVDYARRERAVIIFDAAYSEFINDPSLPRSIYEIEGAKECAIEIQSFSKSAGFTGVRCGWSVVPKALITENSEPGKVNSLWNRRSTTFFNGASNIVQEGALAVLSDQGKADCANVINYYMGNAQVIRKGLDSIGIKHFGGTNAPFIWMQTPGQMDSWNFFDKMLNEAHVVCTPGAGFGPGGEGYVRLSAFGHRENIEKAVDSLVNNLKL